MRFLYTYIIVLFALQAQAQYGCIDSLSISPTYPCPNPQDFNPVCGCDNKTYRNICEAQLRYGVRTWTDGSCSGYEIDIFPTYAQNSVRFTIQQSSPRYSHLMIFDVWGRMWYDKDISPTLWDWFDIPIDFLQFGSYIVYVYDSQGTVRVKRFVKIF